jgi:hypothetical protein
MNGQWMKQTIRILTLIFLVSCGISVCAQVVPSAMGNVPTLYVGGMFSFGQPDYAGNGIAEASPQKLYGFGAYADYRLSRWIQFEGEARWSRMNEYLAINQDTYLVGLREPVYNKGRFIPYGKILAGIGKSIGLDKTASVYALGGGVDYQRSNRLRIRLFDFEYQRWSVHPPLHPYQTSIGLSYRMF